MGEQDGSGGQPASGGRHYGGSIERTLAGQAELDIMAVIREAWSKTDGIKGPVVAGMLLGSGQTALAGGAFMLLATNVICVNLAGVATFAALGLRPRSWWEREGARRSSHLAMLVWSGLLVVILVLIYVLSG